jgi:hypothetical protein
VDEVMSASVRIEDEAFSDERYEDLAHFAGLADADHARGKMAKLWRQCTLENRHILPRTTVVRVLGDRGVEALIVSRLGEEVEEGIRIRGTKGRIEWLKKLRSNGKFGKLGGRPRANPDGLSTKPKRVSKNAKELTPPAPAPAPTTSEVPSQVDADLTAFLFSRITQNNPRAILAKAEPGEQAKIQKRWANHVRLMRERDGHSPDEILAVMTWCQNDPFWKANILSTEKLREKWDTLTAKMQSNGHRQEQMRIMEEL